MDAVCDIAERLGDPAAVPALRRLAAYDLFRDRVTQSVVQPDYFEERKAYLEITIARALARCGDREGLDTLIRYLRDSRKMLVHYAHRELQALSGLDYPAETDVWQQWADSLTDLPCKPWMGGRN